MAEDPGPRAEGRAATAALVTAALMIAQQVGSKATRDALFLSSFAAEDLPRVVIAAAAASMVAVFAAARAHARFGPARVVPLAFLCSALLYAVEWSLAPSSPRSVALLLYLHTAVFGALVISGFWSVVNERFDPHAAKRVVGRIGAGATAGGLAGGLLAERVGSLLDARAMLAVLALLSLAAAARVRGIDRRPRRAPAPEPSGSALEILGRSPYLRTLGALVVLTAVSAGLLDYAFKAEAASRLDRPSDLLSFFAIFHVVAAVLSLLVQVGLTRAALRELRPAGSAALLPAIVLLTAGAAAALTNLATVAISRGAELVMANSVFRSGYELLYTPLPPAEKRPTKALIDVAGTRLGDALGSALVLAVLALAPAALGRPGVLALGAGLAVVSLLVARRLHAGYVRQLSLSLSSGAPGGTEETLMRAATLSTLSTLGLDREALFEQIAATQSYGDGAFSSSVDGRDETVPPPPPEDGLDAPPDDPIHATAAILRRGEEGAIRAALAEGPIDLRLVPFVVALLARRDVHHDAVEALRRVVDEAVEPMVRALTDPTQPFAIRRRLPRVLQRGRSAEGAAGLARALDDEEFEVRYRCAIALARIAARRPELRPPAERVHERVRHELGMSRETWARRRPLDDEEEGEATPLRERRAARDRIHRGVEHVFTLLSLAHEPRAMRLALAAVSGEDRRRRGTALEYLESVLPDDIAEALFPILDARVRIARRRTREEIVADLVRSFQAMDAEELRRAIEAREGEP